MRYVNLDFYGCWKILFSKPEGLDLEETKAKPLDLIDFFILKW